MLSANVNNRPIRCQKLSPISPCEKWKARFTRVSEKLKVVFDFFPVSTAITTDYATTFVGIIYETNRWVKKRTISETIDPEKNP